ncbi:MAG TPA: SMP-30/gluconolactonase/LRE family protein [Stenotrophomonas sp.]|jgi:sugar lactone lactonase YvrE
MRLMLPLLLSLTLAGPALAADTPRAWQAWDYVDDGVFTSDIEGPAVGPDGALYVVNFAHNGSIGRVTPKAGRGEAVLFVELPAGSVANGIRFAADGSMRAADKAGRKLLKIDPASAAVTTLAELPGSTGPNDLTLDSAGRAYLSDPDWNTQTGRLWRVDPDGKVHLLEDSMGTTNGMEISPDGRHLYVNESIQRTVWVYDLHDGELSNKRILHRFEDFGLDGMRCDPQGNLYVARYDGGQVAVLSPQGKLLRTIALKGRKPSNVTFDGAQVYVTLQDRGAIETFYVDPPGQPDTLNR